METFLALPDDLHCGFCKLLSDCDRPRISQSLDGCHVMMM